MTGFFGIIETGEFLFPKYIDKYLNFAIEIVKLCGLILTNNQQYEKILDSEKELQYLSYHDAVTGLYNRVYINSVLNEGLQDKVCVFMFDIDKLKYVNDHFGHLEGDKIIKNVANILKNCFREEDIVARIGGDEFLAVIQESNRENIEHIRNRIYEEIKFYNRNRVETHLEISISIRLEVQKDMEESIEYLMKKADLHMYLDKMSKKFNMDNQIEK